MSNVFKDCCHSHIAINSRSSAGQQPFLKGALSPVGVHSTISAKKGFLFLSMNCILFEPLLHTSWSILAFDIQHLSFQIFSALPDRLYFKTTSYLVGGTTCFKSFRMFEIRFPRSFRINFKLLTLRRTFVELFDKVRLESSMLTNDAKYLFKKKNKIFKKI